MTTIKKELFLGLLFEERLSWLELPIFIFPYSKRIRCGQQLSKKFILGLVLRACQ